MRGLRPYPPVTAPAENLRKSTSLRLNGQRPLVAGSINHGILVKRVQNAMIPVQRTDHEA